MKPQSALAAKPILQYEKEVPYVDVPSKTRPLNYVMYSNRHLLAIQASFRTG